MPDDVAVKVNAFWREPVFPLKPLGLTNNSWGAAQGKALWKPQPRCGGNEYPCCSVHGAMLCVARNPDGSTWWRCIECNVGCEVEAGWSPM